MPKRPRPSSDHEDGDAFFAAASLPGRVVDGGSSKHHAKGSRKKSEARKDARPAAKRFKGDKADEDEEGGPARSGGAIAASSAFFLPPSDDENDGSERDDGLVLSKGEKKGGSGGEERLTINARFAERLQKTAELQAAQRRRARYTGLVVPKGLVVAFNGEIKKALIAERSNTGVSSGIAGEPEDDDDEEAIEEALLIADALTLLTVPEACRMAADKVGIPLPASALPPAEPIDDSFDSIDAPIRGKALARLLSNSKVRDAQEQLIKAVQRAAGAAMLTAGSKTPKPPASGVMVILGEGLVQEGGSESSSKAQARVAPSTPAFGVDEEAVKQALAASLAAATIPSASAAYKRENAARRKTGKIHGRGAGKGRGRGLHPFTGEPKFEDKHPSWQAHVRTEARQAKAITKALRSKPAEALEVRLEGGLSLPE